jgi:hypothetical protein
VVICNRTIRTAAIEAEAHPRPSAEREGHPLVIVDEAFADFEKPSVSLAPSLPEVGLVILRSFSKPYGLGGFRLGFALARSGIVETIREALGPWQVSGPAIEIGKIAFAHGAWREVTERACRRWEDSMLCTRRGSTTRRHLLLDWPRANTPTKFSESDGPEFRSPLRRPPDRLASVFLATREEWRG